MKFIALHRYRRGQGSNPGKPDFFRLSFRNCISCVNNYEDLLYIYGNFKVLNIGVSLFTSSFETTNNSENYCVNYFIIYLTKFSCF